MRHALSVDDEARFILAWFAALELECQAGRVLSRHYRSDYITIYGRVSRFKPAVAGAPSICLADMNARQPGRGLLTAICNQFASADCTVQARVIFVENVIEPRLVSWLARRGFVRDPYSDGVLPSLFLDIRTESSRND